MSLSGISDFIFLMGVEIILIFITLFFLLQPGWSRTSSGEKGRVQIFFSKTGWVFLCLTFCWSFLLGCLYKIKELGLYL